MGNLKDIMNKIRLKISVQMVYGRASKVAKLNKPIKDMTIEEKKLYIVHLIKSIAPESPSKKENPLEALFNSPSESISQADNQIIQEIVKVVDTLDSNLQLELC